MKLNEYPTNGINGEVEVFQPFVDAEFKKLKLPEDRAKKVYARLSECVGLLSAASIQAKHDRILRDFDGADQRELLRQFDLRKAKHLPELANRLVYEAARDNKHRLKEGGAGLLPPAQIISGALQNKKCKNKLKALTDTREIRGCWTKADAR